MNLEIINIKELQNTTAYHEAAHFVFAILNNILDENFSEPIEAVISVSEGKQYGQNYISSSSPNFDKSMKLEEKMVKAIFLKCLMLLSGYATNRVFFNRNINFIDSVSCIANENLTKNTQIKYHSISDKLAHADVIHDVHKTRELLEILTGQEYYSLELLDQNQFEGKIEFLVNQVELIMENGVIQDSIKIVKEELLKNNGNSIKGENMTSLARKIKQKLKNFDYKKYLDNCCNALKDDKWDIPFEGERLPFKDFYESSESED